MVFFCVLFCSQLQSGKIANELEHVSHHVRSKLDEIKRREIERLRLAAIRHVSFFSDSLDQNVGPFVNINVMNNGPFSIQFLV